MYSLVGYILHISKEDRAKAFAPEFHYVSSDSIRFKENSNMREKN